MKHLITEAASLDKIINAVNKDNSISPFDIKRLKYLLINGDPTAVTNARGRFVGKYWKWIYNQFKQNNVNMGDVPELHSALNTYNINKSQINKPIDSYNTLDELVAEIAQYDDSFKAKRTLSKGEQELEKVYEDQYVVVYIPHIWEAARKIGGDTHWCTASSNDHYFNYYLNEYGGEYYDIIRKSDGAKFQIHPESKQFMDSNDKPITFASVFNTSKEAAGLISFLKDREKDISKWEPKTWFDDVRGKLAAGEDPENVFDGCSVFNEGFAIVRLNNKFNYINTEGKLLSETWFDDCLDFEEGFAAVYLNGKMNYINTEGKLLLDTWFDDCLDFNEGFARVELNDKFNYINTEGKFLSDTWFDWGSQFKEGFARVDLNDKFNYINGKGKFLSDKWFDNCGYFDDGFAAVYLNGKLYYMDKSGKLYDKRPTNENKRHRNIVITEQQEKSIKHLLTEAASLDKIINTLSKDVKDNSLNQSDLADLIMTDPTAVTNSRGKFVGKYWKWIYNQYKQGNIHEGDIPELQAALNTYNINKSQINKPIDSYNTLDELVQEIAQYDDSFKAKRTLSKGEQDLEKVYEDQYVTVYIPHTWKAARKIGGDTEWCTASSSDNYFNMYLNDYGGEYYDIIRKLDGAKFQIHPESNQFMDREDKPVNFACVFNTRKEAEGLIRFLKSRGKDVEEWEPKTWFDEVEDLLNQGVDPQNIFDFVGHFQGGFGAVMLCGKYNYIKTDGKLVLPDQWFDYVYDFRDGFGVVRIGKKYNFIGTNCKLVSPDQWFDEVYYFHDGFARVRVGKKYNYIKPNGKLLSPNLWFDDAFAFQDGFGMVLINGKWVYIGTDGSLFTSKKSKTPVDKKTLMEMKRKKIVITEDMADIVVDEMISEAFRTRYSINSNAVLQVVRYLDSHFTRDTITDVTSDDEIEDILVGNRIDSHGQVVDQPTLDKIVKKLENVPDLRGLISDKKIRAKFFSIVVYAWHRRWIDMQTGIIYGLNDFEV